MLQKDKDITMHKIVEHDALRSASAHIFALQDFLDHVVHPSITTITRKIDELSTSENDIAVFQISDFKELKNSTIQGYIIAVQSMWERGVRSMLSACEMKMFNGDSLDAIKKAKWSNDNGGLQKHFQRLIGISMHSFSSYAVLEFLVILANGIRHGDGPSSKRLYGNPPINSGYS